MKLVWTSAARQNLLEILLYIQKDSPQRAVSCGLKIEKRSAALQRFPKIGRQVPEFLDELPDLREIVIDNYRLIYRMSADQVEVVMILHGRRQLSTKNKPLIVSEKVIRLTANFVDKYTRALQKLATR